MRQLLIECHSKEKLQERVNGMLEEGCWPR
jgi:hypothetical protein